MRVQDYYFEVQERPVFNATGVQINDYKAIVSKQNNTEAVVNIAKATYKLVPNRELLEPFMDKLGDLGTRWFIDSSHSFVQPNRMRLQVTFPDIFVSDEESKIPLSVYLHNSYDGSEGIRLFWGAIRAICTNGMIFGEVLGRHYYRHTKGFNPELLVGQFQTVTDKIQTIQTRIGELQDREVTTEQMKQLQVALGKKRLEELIATDTLPDKSQWELYNDITYLISHSVDKPHRAELQLRTSNVFQL
jgi:hypothetical protein